MQVAALVLAAGSSRRFGSDKRLAAVDGEPMLLVTVRNILQALAGFPGSRLQVVLRARDPLMAALLARDQVAARARRAHAAAWPVGMGASIAEGMTALLQDGFDPEVVAICLGDTPFIESRSVAQLLQAGRADAICVPVCHGQRGHPVVFGRDFFPELLALRGPRGATKLLRTCADAVCEIAVDDPGITLDIDRPADFHAAVHRDPADRMRRARRKAAGVTISSPPG